MKYKLHLEYAGNSSPHYLSIHQSKSSLKAEFQSLYENTDVYSLAESAVFTIGTEPVATVSTELPFDEAWESFNKLTKAIGRQTRVKGGKSVSVYLPEELLPILKERGKGSVSAGLLVVMAQADDSEINPHLAL